MKTYTVTITYSHGIGRKRYATIVVKAKNHIMAKAKAVDRLKDSEGKSTDVEETISFEICDL